jgi:hypothetical protein
MIESLAQSETRTTFERLLSNAPIKLVELYELKLDDVMQQPVELAVLAKKTLRIMLDATGPVSVSHLMGGLTTELTGIETAWGLGRGLTEAEISKTIRSSCKGFVSASEHGIQLHLAHQSAREFLETHGIS